MNAQSYLIIKPDGLCFAGEILNELAKYVQITSIIHIEDFCQLAPTIYLDEGACERGNQPIIYGINTIWKTKLNKTSAILILVESSDSSLNERDFIAHVCKYKKDFRKRKMHGGYVEYIIRPEDILYSEFSGRAPQKHLLEKRLDKNGFYRLQLNCLHCPDSEDAYQREMQIIKSRVLSMEEVKTNISA